MSRGINLESLWGSRKMRLLLSTLGVESRGPRGRKKKLITITYTYRAKGKGLRTEKEELRDGKIVIRTAHVPAVGNQEGRKMRKGGSALSLLQGRQRGRG